MGNTAKNKRLTAAVRRLWTDERHLARFRQDPEAALRRYRLTEAEVAAVQSGDEFRLAALGADVRSLHASPGSAAALTTTLFRMAPRLVALLLAAQLVLAAPASTAARGRSRGRARGRTRAAQGRARAGRVLSNRYNARFRAGRRIGLVRAVRAQPTGGQEGTIGLPIDYEAGN